MGYNVGNVKMEPAQLIKMGFHVRNVKMEPDILLKWVIMLESDSLFKWDKMLGISRWSLTVYCNGL